jgi:membrane protein required for colicin V production
MSLFDLAAGLVLIVSALVGWFRGGVREVAGLVALALAAVTAMFALRFTGPIARHALHPVWLANLAAILIVLVALYLVLRVLASAISRRLHAAAALGSLDRTAGAGVGLARGLVALGLANLAIGALTPPDRSPEWIRGARLFPVSAMAADGLKAFAPRGAAIARKVAPAVQTAIERDDPAPGVDRPHAGSLRVEVGRTP